MIEKTILDYLNENVDVPAKMEHGTDETGQYVVIEKTGGSRTNFIYNSTITVQSYADSMYNAAALNEKVKNAMFAMPDEGEVVSVTLNSDYNYTDTTTKKYRYQAVFNVVHY